MNFELWDTSIFKSPCNSQSCNPFSVFTFLQLHTHEELMDQENKLDSQLQHLKEEIHTEVNEGLRTLEMSRLEVLDELQEVHHQKAEISKKLTSFKQVIKDTSQSALESSKNCQR